MEKDFKKSIEESYINRNREQEYLPFDLYVKHILLSHPSVMQDNKSMLAFPEIVAELNNDIEKYGKAEVKQKILSKYVELRGKEYQ